ncbi:MAG TPA: 50S ribosomal protein L18 [Dehalococcoidia bacterium]|jgi:large subunit ribosomal protein L18|nr:50S ribosomal protein L18 [Dehalococcoidia bacterium]
MSASNGKMRRVVRHNRLRSKISGTAKRPRLAVFRSISHIYAQLIDDVEGSTITAASSLENELKDKDKDKDSGKISISKVVGESIGRRAAEKGISEIVFDRGGYKYHGRIKAVAEGAREAGLKF